jgi:hypothetical protein
MARPRLQPDEVGEIMVDPKKNSHGSYRARAYYGTPEGRKETSAYGKTKGEARAELDVRLAKLLGEPEPQKPPTVGEVVWDWWEQKPPKEVDAVEGILEQTESDYCEVIRRDHSRSGRPVDRQADGRAASGRALPNGLGRNEVHRGRARADHHVPSASAP